MGAIRVMDVKAGKTVKVAGFDWVVLDHIEGKGSFCLMKNILEERAFHNEEEKGCNNWENSSLREYLNSESVARLLDGQLALMEVDLTSDDGMKDYGKTTDYIALLTADQYRKYREIIPDEDDWWWLATPWTCNSTYSYYVRSVGTGNTLNDCLAYLDNIGVRLALIFKESVIADDDNPAEHSEADIKDWKEVEGTAVKALAELNEMAETIDGYKDTIMDLLNHIHDKSRNKK